MWRATRSARIATWLVWRASSPSTARWTERSTAVVCASAELRRERLEPYIRSSASESAADASAVVVVDDDGAARCGDREALAVLGQRRVAPRENPLGPGPAIAGPRTQNSSPPMR